MASQQTSFESFDDRRLAILNLRQGGRQYGPSAKNGEVRKPKSVLRFPDLEHSKIAVLNSLPAASSQESYGHAIDEFIAWYCSEPRLAFNRTVVLRYRFFLEQKSLAPSTITCGSRQYAGSLTKLLTRDC